MAKERSIRVILFDLDGTLRDSREMIYGGVEHAIRTHKGITPTREELLPHIHHHSHIHKEFAPDIDEEIFLASYWEKVEELRHTAKPYKGSTDVLRRLSAEGYRLGIVTSASTTADFLKEHGVDEYVEAIVGGPDTEEHKPSAVPVLRALELLDETPERAIMVGDLSADIQASKAAGLKAAIGISHGFSTAKMLKDAGADYIIDTYDQLEGILKGLQNDQ